MWQQVTTARSTELSHTQAELEALSQAVATVLPRELSNVAEPEQLLSHAVLAAKKLAGADLVTLTVIHKKAGVQWELDSGECGASVHGEALHGLCKCHGKDLLAELAESEPPESVFMPITVDDDRFISANDDPLHFETLSYMAIPLLDIFPNAAKGVLGMLVVRKQASCKEGEREHEMQPISGLQHELITTFVSMLMNGVELSQKMHPNLWTTLHEQIKADVDKFNSRD